MKELLPRVVLAGTALLAAGYLILGMYSQPAASRYQVEQVRTFLNRALVNDSAGLIARAGSRQPIRWVRAAMAVDSAAVREWAQSRPGMRSARRGDTLWVTLRRSGSTKRCSPLFPLTAGFTRGSGETRL